MAHSVYTTVYIARGQEEAQIVQGRLTNEGIPSILSYESAGLVMGLTVDGLGQVKIQVPSNMAEEATKLLEAISKGDITFTDND